MSSTATAKLQRLVFSPPAKVPFDGKKTRVWWHLIALSNPASPNEGACSVVHHRHNSRETSLQVGDQNPPVLVTIQHAESPHIGVSNAHVQRERALQAVCRCSCKQWVNPS